MRLTSLFNRWRRRTRHLNIPVEEREAAFRQFVAVQRAKSVHGFQRTRAVRTREARRWSQWVAFKGKHAAGVHRAVPGIFRDRMLAIFRSVEAE